MARYIIMSSYALWGDFLSLLVLQTSPDVPIEAAIPFQLSVPHLTYPSPGHMEPPPELQEELGAADAAVMVGAAGSRLPGHGAHHAFSSCFAWSWMFCFHLTTDCYDIHVVL